MTIIHGNKGVTLKIQKAVSTSMLLLSADEPSPDCLRAQNTQRSMIARHIGMGKEAQPWFEK